MLSFRKLSDQVYSWCWPFRYWRATYHTHARVRLACWLYFIGRVVVFSFIGFVLVLTLLCSTTAFPGGDVLSQLYARLLYFLSDSPDFNYSGAFVGLGLALIIFIFNLIIAFEDGVRPVPKVTDGEIMKYHLLGYALIDHEAIRRREQEDAQERAELYKLAIQKGFKIGLAAKEIIEKKIGEAERQTQTRLLWRVFLSLGLLRRENYLLTTPAEHQHNLRAMYRLGFESGLEAQKDEGGVNV